MNLHDIETEKLTVALCSGVLQVRADVPGINIDISLNPNNTISIQRGKRVLAALPAGAHIEFSLTYPGAPCLKVYMQNKNAKRLIEQMLLRLTIAQLPKSLRRPILGDHPFFGVRVRQLDVAALAK